MKTEKNVVRVEADEADFAAVLGIITAHRSRALMAVNVESLLTYWEIGAFLSPRIHSGSWSTAVVGRLADYIKCNQPELRGYGKSNLYNMARFYDVFSESSFLDEVHRHRDAIPGRKGARPPPDHAHFYPSTRSLLVRPQKPSAIAVCNPEKLPLVQFGYLKNFRYCRLDGGAV